MNRLDRHVVTVQNKMMVGTFLSALAKLGLAFAGIVWGVILLDRLAGIGLPRAEMWFWIGLVAVGAASVIWAVLRRPTRHDAAVAIDERLSLKEKFSTALYARPRRDDEFAVAAVGDAERTADHVNLRRRFPLSFPRAGYGAAAVALAALLTAQFMQPMDLFGREAQRERVQQERERIEMAEQEIQDAMATVQAVAGSGLDDERIELARRELDALLQRPIEDPERARRVAARALQDVNEAVRQQIRENQRFAQAQNQARTFRSMTPPADQEGPVAEAQRSMAQGDFQSAMDELQNVVEQFEQMEEAQRQQAAEQMDQLAKQLQQMADDPEAQQRMERQLQQLGVDQQQARDMAEQMRQAAGGDQQAAEQLQQMVQQQMQQMNDGQGPTPQQQQQINQMMQQMQAQANTQAQAQAMQQAAQQMAQAMQQANQAQAGGDPQNMQQANQQMAQGQQAMQQQMQQLQAIAQDAQQIAAAQAAAQRAADAAADGLGGGGEGQEGGADGGEWAGGGEDGAGGEWAGGEQVGVGEGGEPMGPAAGPRGREFAPGGFQQHTAPTQDIEDGRILASYYVQAGSIKGEARAELQEAARSAIQDAPDEVDQQRISRQSQRVVREYFSSMERSEQE